MNGLGSKLQAFRSQGRIVSKKGYPIYTLPLYRAGAQDAPQEMKGKQATAELMA